MNRRRKWLLVLIIAVMSASAIVTGLVIVAFVWGSMGVDIVITNDSEDTVEDITVSYTVGTDDRIIRVDQLRPGGTYRKRMNEGKSLTFHELRFSYAGGGKYSRKLNAYFPFEMSGLYSIALKARGESEVDSEDWYFRLGSWKY